MDNSEPTFIPRRVEFLTRPLLLPGRPADWSFSNRPAISGTLHYPDGRREEARVALTNEEDAALRKLLTTVGERVVAITRS